MQTNTDELKLLRSQIDEIDNEIIELFIKRMDNVKGIKHIKTLNNIPTTDSKREQEIYDKLNIKYSDSDLLEYIIELENKLIELSKLYQSKK